jgi:hypothetical protein
MLKRITGLLVALAAMLAGPSQAIAQPTCEVTYDVRFYTDASHTVEVGYLTHTCTYFYVLYTLHGTYTNFTTQVPDGTCNCDDPIE